MALRGSKGLALGGSKGRGSQVVARGVARWLKADLTGNGIVWFGI